MTYITIGVNPFNIESFVFNGGVDLIHNPKMIRILSND